MGDEALPDHLAPWSDLLGSKWPPAAGDAPSRDAADLALRLGAPRGTKYGLAWVLFCRPTGATRDEVLAACEGPQFNEAKNFRDRGQADFMKASRDDGTTAYFLGPPGSRPGGPTAVPYGESLSGAGLRQADSIRKHVREQYIEPARQRGEKQYTVRAGDVHRDLGLQNAVPAVCSAVGSRRLQQQAGVELTSQDGPANSTTTTFTFDLTGGAFTVEVAEAELTRRYGAPIKQVQHISAWELKDGRQIALDRERDAAQLWVETDNRVVPDDFALKLHTPNQPRHSGLPPRLSHQPREDTPRAVAIVHVRSMAALSELLNWYEADSPAINLAALEEYKHVFLSRYSDFEPGCFAATSGKYFDEERSYKDVRIGEAREALASLGEGDDVTLGGRLLDILTAKHPDKSTLLNWRTGIRVKELRDEHPDVFEEAAGQLARADDLASAVPAFAESVWPALTEGQTSRPYSESRSIPSMLAALVDPDNAFGINSSPLSSIAEALTGDRIFGSSPLSEVEYGKVLFLAEAIRAVMADDWGWAPRDLWDVQGFIWAVANHNVDVAANANVGEDTMPESPPPTNLILYGPPGTGKTYSTRAEAVRLCDGAVPEGGELRKRYQELVDRRQIVFTTFHQSYAYEEFVEGLRPTTPEDEHDGPIAGFELTPTPGVFQEIARLADAARKQGGRTTGFDLAQRRVYKMSLGRAGVDEHIYQAAIAGNYVTLGWGGQIDWSDRVYEGKDGRRAIATRWNEDFPDATGADPNISQLWQFRSLVREGDILVVSDGNSQFRAVAEVIGPYRFVRSDGDEDEDHPHRRDVRWLSVLEQSLPVDTIYGGRFTMRSIYQLQDRLLKKEALGRLLSRSDASSSPDQFVLIIDEINRANISKVFGELITLIEPDKRLGSDNALSVTLPYSRKTFGVPDNLHIIGTMNTADRSIALLDTALRRRFEFRELMPQPDRLRDTSRDSEIDLERFLSLINERIEYLFDRDHQIGHAYFMSCRSRQDVDDVVRTKVVPLLAEYFYEDWSKVAAVLGDSDGQRFLDRIVLRPFETGTDEDTSERVRWNVRAQFSPDCYDQ